MDKTTCQVCGREIKAPSGVIADHGYKMPQNGWKTRSCEGARYVPYEVSCERLWEVLRDLGEWIKGRQSSLASWVENPPDSITVTETRTAWSKPENVTYTRPDNFVAGQGSTMPRTYANAYDARLRQWEQDIRLALRDLAVCTQRIVEWKAPKENIDEK